MPVIDVPQPAFMEEEEIAIFADAVGKFYAQHAPQKRVEKWREDGMVEREFWREAGAAGLLGVSVPVEYGGHGGDFRHDMVVISKQGEHGVDGFGASLHNTIILPYLVRHGTEEQKQKYLPRLVTGDLVSAIAMSEPDAGSDLQSIKTTALKDGNGYRLNGSKTWISNGQLADFIIVVAKTDPAEGAKGISLLLLETEGAEGFQRGKKLDKIGLDAQDTSELFFDDVVVSKHNLIGEQEGMGFFQLMQELPQERMLVALAGIAAMEYAMKVTLEYTKERKAFGKPIFSFQNTRFKLAECQALLLASRALVDAAMVSHLKGELGVDRAALIKYWITDNQCKLIDECLQLFGGYGYMKEYPIARLWADSRVQRIYGGTNEIMKELASRFL